MRISIIVAVSENGVIGRDGRLPWHLSSDLKTFRRLTMDKPMIMGRQTFESIGKPLDGRDNIVVSRDPEFQRDGVSVCQSVHDALVLARILATTRGADEIMVIGGAAIYEAIWDQIDRIYLTRVHATVEGDRFFKPMEPGVWHQTSRDPIPKGPKDQYEATLIIYDHS